MGIVLHGSCSLLSHGHSHGLRTSGHNHSHNHSHSNAANTNSNNNNISLNNSAAVQIFLSPPDIMNNNGGRNYNINRHNSFSSLNHNSSRSHSRHNSFTKSNNKLNDEQHHNNHHRASIDLLRTRMDEPLIHRMSIDGGLTRISIDNRSYSHNRLCDDVSNLQFAPNQLQHRHSVDSSHSSSADSGRPTNNPKQNINIRAAVIHVIGDFIQSIGVLIAAIVIKMNPNAKIADPICTFLFSVIVIFTTIRIMKDSLVVLLDAVPSNVVLSKLDTELGCIQGVRSVHHLTVWSVSVDWNIMSVHLIVDPNADTDEILQAATTIARKGFDIKHTTIQIERTTYMTDINMITTLADTDNNNIIL